MPTRIYLAPEGKASVDGRGFEPEALTWRTGTLPLMWRPTNDMGHEGAQIVGGFSTISRVERDGNVWLVAEQVVWDSTPVATEALRMVTDGILRSVSVDVAAQTVRIEANGRDGATEWIEAGELIGATIVPIQAFDDAEIELDEDEVAVEDDVAVVVEDDLDAMLAAAEESLTAAAVPVPDFPLAARDREWDGAAAEGRWRSFTDSDDGPTEEYRRGFMWYDADDADNFGAYKLGIVDIVDGEPHIVPAAVFAVAGGRGVNAADIPDGDKATIRGRVCDLYGRMRSEFDDDDLECPFDGEQASAGFDVHGNYFETDEDPDSIVKAFEAAEKELADGSVQPIVLDMSNADMESIRSITAHALGSDVDHPLPPASWFNMVEPDEDDERVVWVDDSGATVPAGTDGARPWGIPLTITADGRVFGHLANWQDCHTGYEDRCVTPPRSKSGYAWFHTGATPTTEGDVPTGRITVGTGHAERHLSAASAVAHYDNTGHAVADVRAVDGELGPWMCGWVRPWSTRQQRHELAASPPSGDWRPRGGHPELLGVLAVNQPGFPLPRTVATFKGDSLASLVASGLPPVVEDSGPSDTDALAARIDRLEALAEADRLARDFT